jgi:carbon storage regulator
MLILTRKKGQSFYINDDIKITVHDTGGESVRIAIDAPKDVRILREELVEETKKMNEEAAGQADVKPESIANLKNVFMNLSIADVHEDSASSEK